MSCIIVKFLAPTNTKGTRLRVESNKCKKVYPYDHALNYRENCSAVVQKHLIKELPHLANCERLEAFSPDNTMFISILK